MTLMLSRELLPQGRYPGKWVEVPPAPEQSGAGVSFYTEFKTKFQALPTSEEAALNEEWGLVVS